MTASGLLLFCTGTALQWIAISDRNLAAAILGVICLLAGADMLAFRWQFFKLRLATRGTQPTEDPSMTDDQIDAASLANEDTARLDALDAARDRHSQSSNVHFLWRYRDYSGDLSLYLTEAQGSGDPGKFRHIRGAIDAWRKGAAVQSKPAASASEPRTIHCGNRTSAEAFVQPAASVPAAEPVATIQADRIVDAVQSIDPAATEEAFYALAEKRGWDTTSAEDQDFADDSTNEHWQAWCGAIAWLGEYLATNVPAELSARTSLDLPPSIGAICGRDGWEDVWGGDQMRAMYAAGFAAAYSAEIPNHMKD